MERRASARSGPAAQVAGVNDQAVMPVRLFPRPARRPRAVSAANGRFDRTPTRLGQAQSGLLLQLLPLMRRRWTPLRFTPQHPFQPQQPGPNELALLVVKVAPAMRKARLLKVRVALDLDMALQMIHAFHDTGHA